jgi:amino acid adenylation domain-containing protein
MNDSGQRAGMTASLIARFEAQVAAAPERVAVATPDLMLSYEELSRAANQVAHALLDAPVVGNGHVALMLDHNADMLVGILGVLKAGKAYVALDPAQPDRRLGELLEDCGAPAVLASSQYLARARSIARPGATVLDVTAIGESMPDEDPGVEIDASQEAYLMYTSGSTGRPKGIVQTHGSIAHYADIYIGRLGLTSDDRLTLLSSYCHDASVVDIFSALLCGSRLCPIDLKRMQSGATVDAILAMQVTIYHSVPSVYRRMLDAFAGKPPPESLRYVVLGGETVHAADFQRYVQQFPDTTRFVNLHGSTESSINAMFVADKRTRVRRATVPLGHPVDGIDLLLLDDDGQPTEVFGELVIRSPHVALGYWQDEEATEQVFARDEQGARLYRTGDRARRRPDGSFEFAGRKDDQLKIHGYRVEPAEVESAMSEHPSVSEVAVLGFEPRPMEIELVAYYVAIDAGVDGGIDWRAFLDTRLPDHMIPVAFFALESMPVTVSGKIDRLALPAPEAMQQTEQEVVAPRTSVEEALVGIWSEVLAQESLGIHHNFFSLGGHSLRAMQVLARIYETFQVELPVRAVFDCPTVAELAQVLSGELGTDSSSVEPRSA